MSVSGQAKTPGSRISLRPWLLLAPGLLLLVPFFLMPSAVLLRNSFNRDAPSGLMVTDFVLDNYLSVLTDRYYFTIFVNTVEIAALVGVISLIIGYPFAYYVVRWVGKWRNVLLWVVYTPLLVSVIVRVFGWMVITGDSGLINNLLLSTGLTDRPLRMLYEVEGMTIGMTHRYLPLMILPLVNSISKIDPALLSASNNLGGGAWRTQWKIVMPLCLPGAASGFQLVFAGVLSDFVLPNLMGTPRFRMLAPSLYVEAVTNLSWANAAAIAIVMVLVVVAMLALFNFAMRRLVPWTGAV